jgi:transposase InsO family protein
MNVHNNARLTPAGRGLLVRRVEEQGWPVAAAAEAAGLSERQGYRWLARYRSGGGAALADRSSAPHRCWHRTPAERVAQIERLRRQRLSGPAIARQLVMPVSTVGGILRRQGLGRLTALDPRPAIVRYERERPGELIHIDIKKLGRIDGIGHRITGQHAGMHRARGAGWDYLHVCIDDASRLAYSEMLPDEKKETAVAFLDRALAWLAGLGVPVERVMTDNGGAYRSRLWRRVCQSRGLRHIFTKPYTPRTNGKAERFIQTSLREWAYVQPYVTSPERTAALGLWLHHYNTQRPHAGLAQCPPITRLQSLLLGSTEGTVASSRPGYRNDRRGRPGQGSPQATGDSRREASLRRPDPTVTLAQGGTSTPAALNNVRGNDT